MRFGKHTHTAEQQRAARQCSHTMHDAFATPVASLPRPQAGRGGPAGNDCSPAPVNARSGKTCHHTTHGTSVLFKTGAERRVHIDRAE